MKTGTAIGVGVVVVGLLTAGIAAAVIQQQRATGDPDVGAVGVAAVNDTQPNVLFVVWDTVRADRLSLYGHDKPTTPFLDEIAGRSVVWENAVSPSYWTLPAHASLFTGLSVSSHGANADYKWLNSQFVTLAEHFGEHGYQTYAWSSNPNINRSANTVQGFQTFHQPFAKNHWRRRVEAATRALMHPRDQTTRPNPDRYKSIAYHKAGAVTHEAFTGWLDEREQGKPFFGFLNYMEAHAYRLPTQDARRAVMPDRAAYDKALTTSNLLKRQTNVMLGRWKAYTRRDRQALYDLYDASIYDLDAHLRRLFAALEARDLLDDTIVVLTSDHGEQFGEHGLYLHNFSVYQPLVKVPLVLHYPAGVTPSRVAPPVSTAGLFHTLVGLTGLPLPDQPILAEDLLHPSGDPVVAELTVPCGHPENRRLDFDVRDWAATYKAVYHEDSKFIWSSNGAHELYNLTRDPAEVRNLFGQPRHRSLLDDLAGRLQAWEEDIPRFELTEEQRAREDSQRKKETEEADLTDELMQLGYIDDEQ